MSPPGSRLAALLVALALGMALAHGPAAASSVRDTPGYVPLADPDSAAERLGRRPNAPLVSMPFHDGAKSLEALGRAVCGALHGDTPDSLLRLCVSEQEFRVILWPEFPQSRLATGLRWDDAWPVLWGRLNGGSVSAVRESGSRVSTLHPGFVIVARDDEGHEQRFDWIRSVAERKGRFKIYSMRD